jgi:hypothetical protein
LVATSAQGISVTNSATVNVLDPYISVQPVAETSIKGATATFSVTAHGASTLHYQWSETVGGVTTALLHQTNSTLSLPKVAVAQNDTFYSVAVSDANGSVTSSPAKLEVAAAVAGIAAKGQPAPPKVLYAGQPVTLSVVVAGGEAPTYQWYAPTGAISGATASTYTIASVNFTDAGGYHVVISDDTLSTPITSAIATLVVSVPEYIKAQPAGPKKGVVQGQAFTLATLVLNSTALPYVTTYQWYSNGIPVSGATSASYTDPVAITNALSNPTVDSYTVVASYSYGAVSGSITSAPALVDISADTKAPGVVYTYPAPLKKGLVQLTNNNPIANSAITLAGIASDNAYVKQVWVSLNHGAYQQAALVEDPGVAVQTWSLPMPLEVGTNTVSTYAVDYSGNISATNNQTFFFVVPATVTVQYAADGGTVTATNMFDSVTTNGNVVTMTGSSQFFVNRHYTLTANVFPNNLFSNWVAADSAGMSISNTTVITIDAVNTNLNLTANFTTNRFLAAAGTYYGLFTNTTYGVTETNAGWITATVSPNGKPGKVQTFSASLFVDGDLLAGAGTFNVDGTASVSLPRTLQGKAPLTLNLNLNFNGTIGTLGGTVAESQEVNSLNNWTSVISGDVYSPLNAPAYAGTYHVLIPGFTDSSAGPTGYGYMTMVIGANGLVSGSGSLADGQPILIQTAAVNTNGDVPVYSKAYPYESFTGGTVAKPVTIYSYEGALLGWLNFTNATPTGDIYWLKNAWTNGFYDGGFSNEVPVFGSVYTNTPFAPVGGPLITNALVTLSGDDLGANITDNISVSNNVTKPKGATVVKFIGTDNGAVTLSFSPATGLVTGTFLNPALNEVETFQGLYLNLPYPNNVVGGFFYGPKGSTANGGSGKTGALTIVP